ncbi:ABC transporter ATP-binding protein [Neobacillus sp. NPDC093182]|uniref:ABC transporter ATP-binding protein n=1 Tax=Neobacillus sp. NPDC093182 TaxID=3364297 RepID=UPI003815C85F
MEEVLKLEGVSVRFGGLTAVHQVDLSVRKGEIIALIGPNGAGKTTLFNLLTGLYQPTSGIIYYKQRKINHLKPFQRVKIGIARTFQNIRLIKSFTVLENVLIAHQSCNAEKVWESIFVTKKVKKKRIDVVNECIEILKMVGLDHKIYEYAHHLPYGEQRLLEIGRALVTNCQLLLLDEPAAGMNSIEKQKLIEIIKSLSNRLNIEILLIEHDMRLVMNIADRIVVLDHGEKIAEGTGSEVRNNPKVVKAYLGEEKEYA